MTIREELKDSEYEILLPIADTIKNVAGADPSAFLIIEIKFL